MTAPQTVADVLDAAADLLEKPGAWTTEACARSEEGQRIEWDSPDAVCFCALGAIFRESMLLQTQALDADDHFGRYLGGKNWQTISRFNDAPGRTQSEVVAALRAAATSARQGESHDR